VNLKSQIELQSSQTDGNSLIGRTYYVVDTKYGNIISTHNWPDEAEHAARARPYSKVISKPHAENGQNLKEPKKGLPNPDVD